MTSYKIEGDHEDGEWSGTKFPGDQMEYVVRRMYLGNTYKIKVDAFYTENFKISANTTVFLGLFVKFFICLMLLLYFVFIPYYFNTENFKVSANTTVFLGLYIVNFNIFC